MPLNSDSTDNPSYMTCHCSLLTQLPMTGIVWDNN